MLARKILSVLFIILLVVIILGYFLVNTFLLPKFAEIEKLEAKKDLKRCIDAIEREAFHLKSLSVDWAKWDDTYYFVQDKNDLYEESNLVDASFWDNNLNLISYRNLNGDLVWEKGYDLETQDTISINYSSLIKLIKSYNDKDSVSNAISGITYSNKGILLYSVCPIVTSENKGPSQGTLLMIKVLNENYLEIIKKQTEVNFTLEKISETTDKEKLEKIILHGDAIDFLSEEKLLISGCLKDYENNPLYVIQVEKARDILQTGNSSVKLMVTLIFILGILMVLFLGLMIHRIVVVPISRLKNHVLEIADKDVLIDPPYLNRKDEIGILANEYKNTLRLLFETRKKLVELSYEYGASESISNFLHETRNLINTGLADFQISMMKIKAFNMKNMKKVVDELHNKDINQERKEKMLEYLSLLSDKAELFAKELEELECNYASLLNKIEIMLNESDFNLNIKPVKEIVRLSDFVSDIQGLSKQAKIIVDSVVLESIVRIPRQVLINSISALLDFFKQRIEREHLFTEIKLISTGNFLIVTISCEKIFSAEQISKNVFVNDHTGSKLHWVANTLNTADCHIQCTQDGLSTIFSIEINLKEDI